MKINKYSIGNNVDSHYIIKHSCEPENTKVSLYRSNDDSEVYADVRILPSEIILDFCYPLTENELYLVVRESELEKFLIDINKTETEAIEVLSRAWNYEISTIMDNEAREEKYNK